MKHDGNPRQAPRRAKKSRWDSFLEVMARLRGPQGCPWDREQTRESLKKYIIEEAYEVLEAVDRGDPAALAEELGDLLLQIVFQAEIARETGEFSMDEVLDRITAKLIRRHPHVFGEVQVAGSGEVVRNWEMIKKEEGGRGSLFDGIPASLPALRRAFRVQQRASTVGFDWKETGPAVEKLREEVGELERALAEGDTVLAGRELGDILFACVNVARHTGVEAEDALNDAVEKFKRRFAQIEKALAGSGRSTTEATLAEMDSLWEDIKRKERGES